MDLFEPFDRYLLVFLLQLLHQQLDDVFEAEVFVEAFQERSKSGGFLGLDYDGDEVVKLLLRERLFGCENKLSGKVLVVGLVQLHEFFEYLEDFLWCFRR